jgi:hypothetical protein
MQTPGKTISNTYMTNMCILYIYMDEYTLMEDIESV